MRDRRELHDSLLRIREMLRKEWRQIFRDPKTKRIIFASPILQLLLFGYAVNTDVRNTSLFVVDRDRTQESRELVDAFTAGGYFRVVGRSDRPAALASALDHGRAVVAIQIPEGFAKDLAAGRGAAVQVLVDGTSSNTATVAQGYANRIVQRFGLDYADAHGQAIRGGVDLRSRAWYNPALESRVYNVPGVIAVILMLMALLLTALAVVRERELGTLEQLMVSPLSPGELILGKTIPVAAIAFIDLALVVLVAVLWFHIPLRGSLLLLVAASSVYILSALGFGLLVSTVSSTQQEAFMGMFLFFLPMIILSGFMYPITSMPWVFQKLTLLNPVRHFLEVVRGIFLKGEGLADLWRQIVILGVMAAAVLGVATRAFRRSLG
ncbi:MAG TPA: ABC transporter permease [Longimicrobiales bacterium]|nr:ABC transporter permease [Longimicrobiales bacterium]